MFCAGEEGGWGCAVVETPADGVCGSGGGGVCKANDVDSVRTTLLKSGKVGCSRTIVVAAAVAVVVKRLVAGGSALIDSSVCVRVDGVKPTCAAAVSLKPAVFADDVLICDDFFSLSP